MILEDADHNLRAAYIHVIADAAGSMLVLIGLTVGRLLGWLWLDPVMGIVGMFVIANWSWNLISASGAVLLDMRTDDGIANEIAHRLESERDDRVSDLHVWRRPRPLRRSRVGGFTPAATARHLQVSACRDSWP